jgi:DNA-binding transcriptional LysR family regulator
VSVRVAGNIVTNSAEMLRYSALSERGAFRAPTFVVADDPASGGLVRLIPDHTAVEVRHQRHNLSTKVRSFIDLPAERFADHQKWRSAGARGRATRAGGQGSSFTSSR